MPTDLLPTICLPREDLPREQTMEECRTNLFVASERIVAPVYSVFAETVRSAELVNLEFPISASYKTALRLSSYLTLSTANNFAARFCRALKLIILLSPLRTVIVASEVSHHAINIVPAASGMATPPAVCASRTSCRSKNVREKHSSCSSIFPFLFLFFSSFAFLPEKEANT